jgi:hypothetical protein
MLHENELVAPEITRLRCHADQVESALVIKIEYLFRSSHFEWISANPIDNVVPQ